MVHIYKYRDAYYTCDMYKINNQAIYNTIIPAPNNIEHATFIERLTIANEENPWQLESSARFSYQPNYIQELSKKYSLRIIKKEKIPARIQNQKPLEVMMYCTQKT